MTELQQDMWRLRIKEQMSLRDIAEMLLGSRTKESTVRYNLAITENPYENEETAKILVFDLETAPCKSYHWRRWKENIGQDQAITESYVLSWSAKWLGDDAVISDNLTAHNNYEQDREDDSAIIQSLANLINEADFVIAHNGKGFDMPVLRTRMAYHGMPPLNPVYVIDTYIIAKREFRLPSYSLDNIAEYFGLGRKLSHSGFKLWRGVVENDPECWDIMVRYNEQDVILLEKVYYKIRAWDTRHPNIALYSDMTVVRCPCCGSTNIHKEEQVYDTTNISKFPVYRCHDCGKPSSSRKSVLDKDHRAVQLRNTR